MDRIAEKNRLSPIFGPDGQPLSRLNGSRNGVAIKNLLGGFSGYVQQLLGTRRPPFIQAKTPFESHAWVFAASMAIANTASQAQFLVYQETDAEQQRRRDAAVRAGRTTRARAGVHRRAYERHLAGAPSLKRLSMKAAEPDYEHPIYDLIRRPNPYQVGGQLMALTHLWMAIRGEAFWVLSDDDGMPVPPGQMPTRIWPLSPDCFSERYANGRDGEIVGWEIALPRWMPGAHRKKLNVTLDEVIQFKFPDPRNPARGLSRIGAAAAGIELDLLIKVHGRSLLEKQAVPRGIIVYENGVLEEEEEEEYRERWEEQHAGAERSGRIAILSGGFKYQSIALSPTDMGHLEQLAWDRDEVLAVMGTPKAVLGVTEQLNYATQIGQTANFWDQTLLPLLRLEEQTLDATMFFAQTDRTFGAFDLSQIDALRVGLEEKAKAADQFCAERLHMPPRVAYQIVGLDVPEYEGDETALVSALATPVQSILEEDSPPSPSSEPASSDDEPVAAARGGRSPRPGPGAPAIHRSRHDKAKSVWKRFIAVQSRVESPFRRRYKKWVRLERTGTLERFDKAVEDAKRLARIKAAIDLTAILPILAESRSALRTQTRPLLASAMLETWDLTLDEIPIPTFAIDDGTFVSYFTEHENLFLEHTPRTTFETLRTSLTAGIQNGETVQQLRVRIGEVYDLGASSHKTLLVARTETASFMNGVRDRMFDEAGFEKTDWLTAEDENVREDHVKFGEHEPVARGTNYLALIGKEAEGVLEYPGDLRAPIGQKANCFIAGTMVQAGGLLQGFSREYSGHVLEVTLASGTRFSVTPNHPVLGTHGWVAAKLLRQGDCVFRSTDGERVLRQFLPDADYRPTPIEELARPLSMPAGIAQGMPEDFHGDGRDGDVHVVRLDGGLVSGQFAQIPDPLKNQLLAGPDPRFGTLDRTRALPEAGLLSLGASECIVGEGRKATSLSGGRLRHPQEHGLAAVSRSKSGLAQDSANHIARHTEAACQVLDGPATFKSKHDRLLIDSDTHRSTPVTDYSAGAVPSNGVALRDRLQAEPGLVVLDQVLNVRLREFAGPVFNLETIHGFYLANSVVSSNCRCASTPAN